MTAGADGQSRGGNLINPTGIAPEPDEVHSYMGHGFSCERNLLPSGVRVNGQYADVSAVRSVREPRLTAIVGSRRTPRITSRSSEVRDWRVSAPVSSKGASV